jgi:hypothetical protein
MAGGVGTEAGAVAGAALGPGVAGAAAGWTGLAAGAVALGAGAVVCGAFALGRVVLGTWGAVASGVVSVGGVGGDDSVGAASGGG